MAWNDLGWFFLCGEGDRVVVSFVPAKYWTHWIASVGYIGPSSVYQTQGAAA